MLLQRRGKARLIISQPLRSISGAFSTQLPFKRLTATGRQMMVIGTILVTGFVVGQTKLAAEQPDLAASRPNIVWIISEDNSKHSLRHFDADGAPAPAIEALAERGVTFDRAFSNAPVCSVARTTLITGCFAPRMGTQYHRPYRKVKMPPGIKMFPAYLRAAGYYTTNNRKEDYNALKSDDVWDESSGQASWQNRPSNQTSFFHVQTITLSHEGKLHFDQSELDRTGKADPDQMKLPPYLPDTPLFRVSQARHHDLIALVDQQVSQIVEDLRKADELENTIIFYFGDHGGVLPGSKGYTKEAGLHVPLVIRVGKKHLDRAGRPTASRTDGFVEFVDFGPTVLSLAGVEIPDGVDGEPFLGPDVDADEVDRRDQAFGYADRLDEKYEMVRTLRVGDWKYVRNFESHYPDALQNNYRYKMLAYQQWREMFHRGELDDVQAAFFLPKAPEALFDLSTDPHETVNLAGQPEFRVRLKTMRNRLMDHLSEMPDLGFIPECFLVDQALGNPVAFGAANRQDIDELMRIANIPLLPWGEAELELQSALQSPKALVRYWAVVAAIHFGQQAEPLLPLLEARLVDIEPITVGKAVEFFATHSFDKVSRASDLRPFLVRSLQRTTHQSEMLLLLGSAVYVRDHCESNIKIDLSKIRWNNDWLGPRSQISRRKLYLESTD